MSGDDLSKVLIAGGTIVVVLLLVFLVDRAFKRRGRQLAERMTGGHLDPVLQTRLRFVRRLVSLALILVGTLAALSQFEGLGRVAGSLLASGALVAAIVGFAARSTLANLIAGIMLTITQPLRVGDWITFEDHYGVVEDVRLNFTVLRTLSEQRVVIPNERLVSGILRNDTLETVAVGLDVSVWLPAGADVPRALDVLRESGLAVTIAETAADGTRLAVGDERVPPAERAEREAELRERAMRRLAADGLLGA